MCVAGYGGMRSKTAQRLRKDICKRQARREMCAAAHNKPPVEEGRCRSLTAGFICEYPRGYVGRTCQDHPLTRQELDESFASRFKAQQKSQEGAPAVVLTPAPKEFADEVGKAVERS
eukprot:scpid55396/ scgid28572/ 